MTSKFNIDESSTYTLTFDLDDMSAREVTRAFRDPWDFIKEICSLQADGLEAWSTSRESWHVEIHLQQPIPDLLAVFIQTVLKSDFKRETLNFMRILHSDEPWNTLCSEKWHDTEDGEHVLISREKPAPSLTKALERIVLGK